MNNLLWLVTKGGNIQRYPATATLPSAPVGVVYSGTCTTEVGFRTFNAASAKEGVLAADAIGEVYGVNLAPRTETYTGAP